MYLKCTFNGNVIQRYTIAGYRNYFVESFYVQSHGTVYFTVSDDDDNVVTVNGKNEAQLVMDSQTYIYRPTLYTNRLICKYSSFYRIMGKLCCYKQLEVVCF